MQEPRIVRLRCLAVVGVATGLLAALAAFLLPEIVAAAPTGAAAPAGRAAPASFEDLLVAGCAVAALLAACWLWALTCLVGLRAAGGRAAATRAVPAALRRLVLVACGVALAGTASVPAGAAPGTPGGIGGLPFPDRATGAASAVVSAPVARPSRRPRAAGVGGVAPALSAAIGDASDVATVRPGDTLWGLAVRHLPPGTGAAAVTACWQRIHALNRDVIGDDPDLIRPGQRLHLPRRCPGPPERKQP